MRRVRWFGVVFVALQFALYKPTTPTQIPFSLPIVGLEIALLLLCVNAISLTTRNSNSIQLLERIGTGQLVADTLVVLGIVWIFSFDPGSSLWALLTIPTLEGAIRKQLRGAIAVWAGCAVVYAFREWWASHNFPLAIFRVDSITYRMGIVLIVALAAGYLSRNLNRRMTDELEARRESEHRARLLRIVANASRTMTTPDVDRVLATVVESAIEVGFESAGIAMLDSAKENYRMKVVKGLSENVHFGVVPASTGIVGLVKARRETVTVGEYSEWSDSLDLVRSLGLRAVCACPIWSDDDLEAVLIVGTTERNEISRAEIECLDLLALQAGTALTNVRHFLERKELQAQLHHEALHDSLTGLPNRSLFLDRLAHTMERKASAPTPTAVLFFDLDDFKKINDSLGHLAGDSVLRSVAQRLETSRGAGDTAARYGGDEFVLLMEEVQSRGQALSTANTVLAQLQEAYTIEGRDVVVTASVGIAYGSPAPGSTKDFVREADLAMQRAKKLGGGRAEVYRPEMIAQAEQRLAMEFELRRGFEESTFVLYYQPVVRVPDRQIVALEALVRWRHPERGFLLPMDFIPFAEESELIVPLGRWILDEVCRQVNMWRAADLNWPRIPVSINLSAKEFRQENFVDVVVDAFEDHKIHPSEVVFEVTESVLMRDNQATLAQMRRLGRLGVRMAIDDFGLGYSSLSYLKRFPFSILKIDRSFVDGITATPADQAIVRSVLGLANDLGIQVVAEGVEKEEQLEYLSSIGCNIVQGYHLYPPLQAHEIPSLVTLPLADLPAAGAGA